MCCLAEFERLSGWTRKFSTRSAPAGQQENDSDTCRDCSSHLRTSIVNSNKSPIHEHARFPNAACKAHSRNRVESVLSPRPSTPILLRVHLRRVAPLRLRLVVELPARHVVDAPLTGVGGEVAFDGLGSRAPPGALWRDTGPRFGVLPGNLRNRHRGS